MQCADEILLSTQHAAACDTSWHIIQEDRVESTQTLAIAAAQTGVRGRTAYVAAIQTAGRGRDNREWRAPAGNLNFSALIRPGAAAPIPGRFALSAGIAIHEAIAASLPDPAGLILKWPNDLLLHGGKLAGILIDSALASDGALEWVVIGVGANLAEAPVLPDRPTTCLAAHGTRATPSQIVHRLTRSLDRWLDQPLPLIREAWLARAHASGTPLRVHHGGMVVEGRFEGLTEDGGLLLADHKPILYGDVTLRPIDQQGAHAPGR